MIRVGVVGAGGRMGSTVCRLVLAEKDLKLTAAVERRDHPDLGRQVGDCPLVSNLHESLGLVDVLVDFALAADIPDRARAAAVTGKAYVCGVTGLSDEAMEEVRRASAKIAVVYAANFSVGVSVLNRLATYAAGLLGPGYDIEIVEAHHRQKRDAPSGTAKNLAESLGRTGPGKQVPVHSIRAGDVVGDHTVVLAGPGERLELTHRATSREVFAYGTLRAIRFVAAAKPGFYSLSDVLAVR